MQRDPLKKERVKLSIDSLTEERVILESTAQHFEVRPGVTLRLPGRMS